MDEAKLEDSRLGRIKYGAASSEAYFKDRHLPRKYFACNVTEWKPQGPTPTK